MAEVLSEKFTQAHYSPIQRVPVTGRTGPDLTTNEFGLVIDVKSRKCIPAGLMRETPVLSGELIAYPLFTLPLPALEVEKANYSKVISGWYWHMDEWRRAHYPSGISAIVLHRPGMPVGRSMLVIHSLNQKEFEEKWKIRSLVFNHPPR